MTNPAVTQHAGNVLRTARQEARWFGSGRVETIHLLLALIKEDDCTASTVLAGLGVNLKKLRLDLEGTAPETRPSGSGELPLSLNFEQVAGIAQQEADKTRDVLVGTEHLLLGILDLPASRAARILLRFDVDPDKVRRKIAELKTRRGIPELNQDSAQAVAGLDLGSVLNRPEAAKNVYRILDANLNRAGEAIRVIEDCARFVMDHPVLAGDAKALRHRLQQTMDELAIASSQLLQARDTAGDVGTLLSDVTEMKRADLAAVLRANFRRLQESLRTLEEYAKLLEKPSAPFERLRYDAYMLEKSFSVPPPKRASLEHAALCVLVSRSKSGRPTLEVLEEVLAGGCRMVQLREKELPDRELLELARKARRITRNVGALLIVNDRADVARRVGADGVHVGQTDLPVNEARHVVGFDRLVGASAHTADQALQAEAAGADYIGVGPIFPSPTKPHLRQVGVSLLREISSIRIPFFAIGGVNLDNVDRILALGARRVAVGSAVVESPDICQTTKLFVDRLEKR